MCRVVQGALYPAVRPKDIRQFQIPLPPVEEQRRIVAEIEKQFTRLDAGVASLKRVRTALKRYRASVLKAAVEGRLVPNEAELARGVNCTYETGEELLRRVLKERRDSSKGKRTYKEPVLANAVDLPVLPRGWTWSSVEQLAAPEPNSITDGPFGSNLKTEHYTASGPRVVRLQNIGDGEFIDEEAHISKEHFDRLRKHRVDAGDLVIAALGSTPPRSCLIPTSLGPAIVKADCIRFKVNNKILADYINFALNSDPVRNRTKRIVHGVGRPRLNLAEIKAIVLPLPPRKEQERIVVELERRLSIVQRVSQIVEQSHSRAGRLKQAILDQTFARGTPANVAPDDNVHSQSSAPAVAKEQVQHQPTMTRRARRRIKPTRSLLEILKANPAGITPEELFRASGYLNNGDPDSFYRELAMIAHLLEEQKPSGSDSAAWPGESRVLLKLKVAAA